jgi:hypothetical protein
MPRRLFRTMLLLTILIGVLVVSGELVVRAIPPSTHAQNSFQPSGHGIAYPQRINAATLPHTTSLGSTAMSTPSSEPDSSPVVPVSHPTLPPPQNVVKVPPPTSTNPSARQGLSQKLSQQPDANGAGGLDNFLETVNRSVGIFSRGGAILNATSFQTWFNLRGAIYDPVTMWDNTGNRFLFSADDSGTALLLSVAQQTNATGSFCNYTFHSPSGVLADFDKLGVDSDGIYLSANLLDPSTGNVVSNELFYASRTALENCQHANYTTWTGLTNPDGSIAQAITPARQDTSAGGVEYLLNSYPSGACQLTLWTLTSSGTLSNTSVPTQCYSPPPNAKQKGTTTQLIVDDCSITQASYVNGLLTVDTLGSYDWKDGNGPVGIVEWYVVNPSTASVSSQGAFGTPGYWLFYPSTIMTPNGHMLFVYNASGPSSYVSVWYVNQVLTTTTALVNGAGPYGTGTEVGWGDYQSAWQDDPSISPNSVWITGAYATSSNSWSTKFALVSP